MNLTLLLDNALMRATITSPQQVTALPVTNLHHPHRTVVSRLSGTGPWYWEITLAAGETIGAVALVGLNLPATGTIRFNAWSDGHNGAFMVVDHTITAWPTGVVVEGIQPVPIYILPAISTARYWTITCNDNAADLTYLDCGVIYIGPVWQPTTNYNWGMTLEVEDRTRIAESAGGQAWGDRRTPRHTMRLRPEWLTDPERHQLYTQLMHRGPLAPLVVCARPDSNEGRLETTLYATCPTTTIQSLHSGVSATDLTIRESL